MINILVRNVIIIVSNVLSQLLEMMSIHMFDFISFMSELLKNDWLIYKWLAYLHSVNLSTISFALCCLRNLQAAIGAYYDFESPNVAAPCMSFVRDVTIGEGESVPPDTPFTKTWRIQNTGPLTRAAISTWQKTLTCHGFSNICRCVCVCYRCRVVASWGLSEVRRWRSVWSRKHGDGEVPGASGNDWCERADAEPCDPWDVPGPVENVHSHWALLRRWGGGNYNCSTLDQDQYISC